MTGLLGGWLTAAVLLAVAVATPPATAQPSFVAPPIYDFFFRYQDNPDPQLYPIPLPVPGLGISPDNPLLIDLLADLAAAGLPVSICLTDHVAPLTGTSYDIDPDDPGSEAFQTILPLLTELDYLLLDFESKAEQANMVEVFDMLAAHPDPDVRSARIGNYAFFPGHPDLTVPEPGDIPADLLRHSFYMNQDELNVAMPHAYVFAILKNHADPEIWSGQTAPNVRAALFWGPLERVSLAARNLPEGDQLIPYVAGFLPQNMTVEPPTAEDVTLIMLHYRMRGIDGYSTFKTNIPLVYEEYRWRVGQAYHSLDCFFEGDEPPTLHNLDTSKTTGLQWSGITRGDDSAFIISNLGDEAASVGPTQGWPTGLPGVPPISPSVPPGEHLLLLYDNGPPLPCVDDCNGNGLPDAWDILVGTSEDCDYDTIPDECFVCCPADVNGDGGITVDDLLLVILEWGREISIADTNNDGAVDVDDLVTVLTGWGGCF